MKSLIFIAPPAAGKGTQSEIISKKYNIPSISTGDLLRDARNQDNEIGRINDVSSNWIKDITYKMGNLVQSSRTDIPRGLIKTDGLDNNGEISYTPENYPDLYDALLNNKIK